MFSHVFLGTENIERAKSFYDPIMRCLATAKVLSTLKGVAFT